MKFSLVLLALVSILTVKAAENKYIDQPDSVYLFSYALNPAAGLQFAWSANKTQWNPIGGGNSFLRSDYGPGRIQKKLFDPFLLHGPDGLWHCVWSLNDTESKYAHAASPNLVDWNRQSYLNVTAGSNFLRPSLKFDPVQKKFLVSYVDSKGKYFTVATSDFKNNEPARETSVNNLITQVELDLPVGKARGHIQRVEWALVSKLIEAYQFRDLKNVQKEENAQQDAYRFAGLNSVDARFVVNAAQAKPISNMLMGIFFEDLNYAADGGLYAELIQNRDFEYDESDLLGKDKNWNHSHSWTAKGLTFTIDSINPIHVNNPHYALLKSSSSGGSLTNSGFDGIALTKGGKYNLAFFAKSLKGKQQLKARLISPSGQILGEKLLDISASSWKKIKVVLTSNAKVDNANLELQVQQAGTLAIDLVSLFPENTYKGRTNGLRADLANVIAEIRPRFVRFPGGCLAHGDGIANIYRWKSTIGALEARKPQRNIWNYHQTVGLGYLEYFQFCEDIGAEPLPVVAAGVPCQNSIVGGNGQAGGIPMDQMDEYVQDIIDLVEWANGDVNTKWGKIRAEAGHPEPFNLKYIGIGNEDLITDVFEERFTMLFNAMKKAHPEITVIGTVGPNFEGTDYREGWAVASKLKVPMVDEHYYNRAGWFINNQNFYDSYDRSKSKVYLGEYAANVGGKGANFESALAEAIYLTSLERNGDVVEMSSYAPLLAKEGHTQWNPDMIYFNNTEVKTTAAYQVQKLYGQNPGDLYLPTAVTLSNNQDAVKKRIGISVVRDTKSNEVIVKMVNLLPVSVKTQTDLQNMAGLGKTVIKTELQTSLTDKDVKPVISQLALKDFQSIELKPYSFTVFRIR